MKEHFINELRRLFSLLCEQGQQVENLISQAISTFAHLDAEGAAALISKDAAIDAGELRIEEECLKVLALYQPVATDLRTVVAILKINTSLERMADFGVHIAERVTPIARQMLHDAPAEPMDFTSMEQAVLSMLRDSLAALRHSDPALAYRVIDRDDEVDKARRDHSLAARAAIRQHPEQVDYYIDCTGISRDLERIADLATDICEHIIYLGTGRIVRHTS